MKKTIFAETIELRHHGAFAVVRNAARLHRPAAGQHPRLGKQGGDFARDPYVQTVKRDPSGLFLQAYGRKSCSGLVLSASHPVEVAAQRHQSGSFLLDLMGRSKAKPPKNGDRRTPSLDRMLKKECSYQRRERKPAAIAGGTEHGPGKCQSRCVGLDRPLNVPFLPQLAHAARNLVGVLGVVPDASPDVLLNPSIDIFAGVTGNAI